MCAPGRAEAVSGEVDGRRDDGDAGRPVVELAAAVRGDIGKEGRGRVARTGVDALHRIAPG